MSINHETEPTTEAVANAAAARLDRSVSSVIPLEEGMNAVYRVSFDDGLDTVVKVGTVTDGPKLLSGPLLIERLERQSEIPVPKVLTVVSAEESSIGHAYFLMEYVDGRVVTDVHELSPTAHEQLVREAGRHLAELHELPWEGAFGRLEAHNGELQPGYEFDTWASAFSAEVDYHLDHIDERFTDIEPLLRDGFDSFSENVTASSVDTSILYRDYHPKNLVLNPDDADPLVRAVLDFNFRLVGDAPLDVAIAEGNIIDLPVRATERAEHLRTELRASYVEARGGQYDEYFDEWYPYYRLIPTLDYMIAFDYFAKFAWEDESSAVAERLRSFIRDRIGEFA